MLVDMTRYSVDNPKLIITVLAPAFTAARKEVNDIHVNNVQAPISQFYLVPILGQNNP